MMIWTDKQLMSDEWTGAGGAMGEVGFILYSGGA